MFLALLLTLLHPSPEHRDRYAPPVKEVICKWVEVATVHTCERTGVVYVQYDWTLVFDYRTTKRPGEWKAMPRGEPK